MIDIKIDAKEVIAAGKAFEKVGKDIPKYTADSINKGLDKGKPKAEGLITGRYAVDAPNLGMEKASPGNLKGSIVGSGGMLPVSQFGPSQSGKVVSVTIIRGSRKAIVPGSRGPGISGAFMVGGRVMERRQQEKYPIYPVSTIGIPQMLGSRAVADPTRDLMAEISSNELGKKLASAVGAK